MDNLVGQKIAMLGVGGAGMRGLALILASRGAEIYGVDREATEGVVDEVTAAKALPRMDMIIHTDAIKSDHPLLKIAKAAGIPTKIYHEALGELTRALRTIAVTGTHGKSSTTSMLAHIFAAAGRDPLALVGASIPAWNDTNARLGSGDVFIIEADEYRNHFLALKVESAIITTIDFDHPDFFESLDDVKKSFSQFVQVVATSGIIVVPSAVVEKFPDINWPAHTQAIDPPGEPIQLILPGAHMQYNAWLAIQMAAFYGITEDVAREALANFRGLGRRFELLGQRAGMDIISDYGHHPEEIAATLAAARERYPQGKICVIFEAHTKERFLQFLPAFCEALGIAEGVVIAPVFVPAGRDNKEADIAAGIQHLSNYLRHAGKKVYQANNLSDLSPILTSLPEHFDVAIAFSAGSVDRVLRTIVNEE